MFARKIRVEYEENGQRQPCPLKWLDSFSMRNFTNDQVFDDTIPAGDGADGNRHARAAGAAASVDGRLVPPEELSAEERTTRG